MNAKDLKLDKPQVVGVVITQNDKKINLAPVIFQAISSAYEKPMVVCIGLSNKHFSLRNILKNKEFTFAFPSTQQIKDIDYCGGVSGWDEDKIINTTLEFESSKVINTPSLLNAVINYECMLHKTVKLETFTIVISEIKNIQYSLDKNALDKIYLLGGREYGVIKDLKSL